MPTQLPYPNPINVVHVTLAFYVVSSPEVALAKPMENTSSNISCKFFTPRTCIAIIFFVSKAKKIY
jgi:hypothetical protein